MTNRRAAIFALLVAGFATATLSGQARPGSDPRQEIRTSVAAAQKDGNPVVLNFGAEWCLDCRVLWKLLSEPELAAFVEKNFHWVEIDVGEYFVGPESPKARNLDVAATYGVDLMKEGVPALVIPSSAGKPIPAPRQIDWSKARGFSASDVLKHLEELLKAAKARSSVPVNPMGDPIGKTVTRSLVTGDLVNESAGTPTVATMV